MRYTCIVFKVTRVKGTSETKSKQQSPCINCMHQPVTSWVNACSTCIHWPGMCMHRPVTSQANTCTYCMGSKVLSLSRIYLYSSYFALSFVQQQIIFLNFLFCCMKVIYLRKVDCSSFVMCPLLMLALQGYFCGSH